MQSDLMQRLRMRHPIVQAPLAGGGDTPALVAAVSNAGGLGFIGAAYLTPRQIVDSALAVRKGTPRPFGINLFVPTGEARVECDPEPALKRIAPFYRQLGLSPPAVPPPAANIFAEQLAAALESGAAVFSFTMGVLPRDAVSAVRDAGMMLMGTATTVEEAVALEQAGVDAVVAQGSEAGGHRGTFAASFDAAMIGTMSLVPQIADAVSVPVIASGGIMDGRGIAAALALGAQAVQMGTAFLTCDEAGVPDQYKAAILDATEQDTLFTRAFSGRPARGIVNAFMKAFEKEAPGEILPFPFQNALTRPLRAEAARLGRTEFLSLWAGQGLRMARRQSAGDLVKTLAAEARAAIAGLTLPAPD